MCGSTTTRVKFFVTIRASCQSNYYKRNSIKTLAISALVVVIGKYAVLDL